MDLVERRAGLSLRHPWEQARASFFAAAVERISRSAPMDTILDVGAGDGYVAERLVARVPHLRVTCCDAGYDPATLTELSSRLPSLAFSRELPVGQFSAITLLDVLEHVEDDDAFLSTLVRDHLAPGGHLFFAVPAWPRLFTSHDTKLRHFRRYTPAQARAALTRAGLELLEHGGLFHSLLPVRVLEKLLETLRPRAESDTVLHGDVGAWRGGPLLTRALTGVLGADGRVSAMFGRAGLSLPGLSTWAVCRKP
jgi:SAM-dependent methyltransferase